ncbi:hypothetical protein CWO85_01580 [Candidatus Phytoplasma ziziphi]|uniref:Uncharacterized protein n=1 Tax=Ziziphus jujuba witches'-broom phytoplasma TaxID=135727 RepID=A0A660HMF5_ZIZJU|nr:hypothetical protein [Candidatus Phytoplasma ziziphi]AYJ01213.1 hypothetical protein CWO85_01580 [Candidatus Phytoplasma ziziphi]
MEKLTTSELKQKNFYETKNQIFKDLINEFLTNKDINDLRYKIFKQDYEIINEKTNKLNFEIKKVKNGFFYSFIKPFIYKLSKKVYFPISLSIEDSEQESFFIFNQFLNDYVLKNKKYNLSFFRRKLTQGLSDFIQKYLGIKDKNKFSVNESIKRNFQILNYQQQDEILLSISLNNNFSNPIKLFNQETKFQDLKEKIEFVKLSKNQEKVLTKYYQLDRKFDDMNINYLSNQEIADSLNKESELNNDVQRFDIESIKNYKKHAIKKLAKLFFKKTITKEITSNLFHTYEINSSLEPMIIVNNKEIKDLNKIIEADKKYSKDKIFVTNYLKTNKKLISMTNLNSKTKEEKIFYPNTPIIKTINLYNIKNNKLIKTIEFTKDKQINFTKEFKNNELIKIIQYSFNPNIIKETIIPNKKFLKPKNELIEEFIYIIDKNTKKEKLIRIDFIDIKTKKVITSKKI